jgi:hypothetical protein
MYSGGSGTELDPYLISTVQDLIDVASNQNKYFKQINDISLVSIANWTPFTNFTGLYDGNNFKITNYASTQGGLFKVITGGTAKNIIVEVTISVEWYSQIGGLVNTMDSGYLENIKVSGTVIANTVADRQYFGGVVGRTTVSGTTVSWKNSCFVGTVTGSRSVGGFIGNIYLTASNALSLITIEDCYSIGNVTGFNPSSNNQVGGFVGAFASNSYDPFHTRENHVSNCYAVGVVTSGKAADTTVGGFVGYRFQMGDFTWQSHDNFYDSTVSGLVDTKMATPKTTAQMKTQSTFTNWDFTTIPVWVMDTVNNSGYPNLKWYYDTLVQLPNLKVNIGGSLGTYVDGWVNIDGVACRIDKIWIRVADALKLI